HTELWCSRPQCAISGRRARIGQILQDSDSGGMGDDLLGSSRTFGPSPMRLADTPVTLAPGRARLATKPYATGPPTSTITIGIVLLAWMAARVAGEATATITATWSRTNS